MFASAFPDKELIAQLTAKMLIEVEAVHFRADDPFRFTSGWASPVYIDPIPCSDTSVSLTARRVSRPDR